MHSIQVQPFKQAPCIAIISKALNIPSQLKLWAELNKHFNASKLSHTLLGRVIAHRSRKHHGNVLAHGKFLQK